MDNDSLAKRIRKYMDLQKLSVEDLVDKTGLGRSTIYKILADERGVTLESVKKIAKGLDVPVSVLTD